MSAQEQDWQDDQERDRSAEQQRESEQSPDLGQTARYEDGTPQDRGSEDDDEGHAR